MDKRMTATAAAMASKTADQVNSTDQGEQTAAAFADLMRSFECAYVSGADYSDKLLALATACAQSVLKKCVDPQRKTAAERETVSNTGLSPALVSLKRGIVADLHHLDNLTAAHNAATAFRYNAAGDYVREVVDKDAEKAATALQGETLSDGLDLVNTAVVAILEEMQKSVNMPGFDDADIWAGTDVKTRLDAFMWCKNNEDPALAEEYRERLFLEEPYRLRRLSRHVLIREEDSAKWETVETSAIREVYRAIRREVQNSRAMQTDPRNGYLYIEDTAADPDSDKTETIYRRLHKWADLGGYTHTGDYTADMQTMKDYNAVIAALNLTDRQAQIVRLRMSGYGYQAIAQYLGIKKQGVLIQMQRLQAKCEKLGFSPSMWAEMTAEQ